MKTDFTIKDDKEYNPFYSWSYYFSSTPGAVNSVTQVLTFVPNSWIRFKSVHAKSLRLTAAGVPSLCTAVYLSIVPIDISARVTTYLENLSSVGSFSNGGFFNLFSPSEPKKLADLLFPPGIQQTLTTITYDVFGVTDSFTHTINVEWTRENFKV